MRNILKSTFIALLLIVSLAACASQETSEVTASAAPLPSPTAGTKISTFMCKVTSIKNISFKITMYNITFKTAIYEEPNEEVEAGTTAAPSPEAAATKPPSSSGESKNINVEVPPNVVVKLLDGAEGKLSDIRVGNVVNMTMINNVVTEISLVSTK